MKILITNIIISLIPLGSLLMILVISQILRKPIRKRTKGLEVEVDTARRVSIHIIEVVYENIH